MFQQQKRKCKEWHHCLIFCTIDWTTGYILHNLEYVPVQVDTASLKLTSWNSPAGSGLKLYTSVCTRAEARPNWPLNFKKWACFTFARGNPPPGHEQSLINTRFRSPHRTVTPWNCLKPIGNWWKLSPVGTLATPVRGSCHNYHRIWRHHRNSWSRLPMIEDLFYTWNSWQ